MDVAIIDYQMSNLHSVQAACSRVGLTSVITSDPKQILSANLAILPGVGAFGEAMQHLSKSGLDDCIRSFVDTGKPFVGICLGLQLLFEESQEFGIHKGLGLIKGTVKKFSYREEKKSVTLYHKLAGIAFSSTDLGKIACLEVMLMVYTCTSFILTMWSQKTIQ